LTLGTHEATSKNNHFRILSAMRQQESLVRLLWVVGQQEVATPIFAADD